MASKIPAGTETKSKKRNWIWAVTVSAGLILLLVLLGIRVLKGDSDQRSLGDQPKDFLLRTFSGEPIGTSDLRGSIVLIHFWASWCLPCDEEVFLLEEVWQDYATNDAKDIVFLGIAYMDTEPASLKFIEDHGITFPNGPDLRGEISKIYRVNAVPETYILDTERRLRYVKFGSFLFSSEITAAINQVKAAD